MIFIDGKFSHEIKLSDETITYLKDKNVKSVALFASVQFLALDDVKAQLAELGIEVKLTKAKRTHAIGQILGCDAYHDSLEEDIISTSDLAMYVGDGMFHPKALLLSQIYNKEIKPIVIFDPTINGMRIIDTSDVIAQIKKIRANIMRFLLADTIGILVTVKPGQQYLHLAERLKKKLEEKGKEVFIFMDETLRVDLLENFPFIDTWVNTACPRIGTDDITTIVKPLLNIREALEPEKSLENLYTE